MNSPTQILARLDRIPLWPWRYTLLWVLGAGYFFAFFDIVNIGAALPEIARQFGISTDLASWAITASLIAYIIGSFVNGTIADLFGRRLGLMFSVGAFTLGSIGAALSPSIGWLIAFRFVAGLGLGAEIASVTTYLGEISPARVRGKYTSWATACAYAGFVAVPFVARVLVPNYTWGWRWLFLIGAAGGVTIFLMRRHLRESPRWLVAHGRADEAETVVAEAEQHATRRLGRSLPPPEDEYEPLVHGRFPALALFGPRQRGPLFLLIALWFFYYIGNYGWLEMMPTLLEKAGHSIASSLGYLIVSGIGFLVGAVMSIWLNDRIERKVTIFLTGIVWVAALLVVGLVPRPAVIMPVGFVASTTIGLMVPIMYTLTAEHFATVARTTGVALTDGLGHIGGAIAPMLVLLGAERLGFFGGMLVMALSGVAMLLLLPFTVRATGKALESD